MEGNEEDETWLKGYEDDEVETDERIGTRRRRKMEKRRERKRQVNQVAIATNALKT